VPFISVAAATLSIHGYTCRTQPWTPRDQHRENVPHCCQVDTMSFPKKPVMILIGRGFKQRLSFRIPHRQDHMLARIQHNKVAYAVRWTRIRELESCKQWLRIEPVQQRLPLAMHRTGNKKKSTVQGTGLKRSSPVFDGPTSS
jgi:hypothetical protein